MPDVVVTVPQSFGLARWCEEGDCAGEEWSGTLWAFTTWGPRPDIHPGERVYVVYGGRLIGYAPLVRLECDGLRAHVALLLEDGLHAHDAWLAKFGMDAGSVLARFVAACQGKGWGPEQALKLLERKSAK